MDPRIGHSCRDLDPGLRHLAPRRPWSRDVAPSLAVGQSRNRDLMAVSGSERTRVLVIDDDQDLGALLARYLRGFDFEVSVACDAANGLQANAIRPISSS